MCLGVAWFQWVWRGPSGCGVALVGLARARWVWDSLSRCGMASVGVTWSK